MNRYPKIGDRVVVYGRQETPVHIIDVVSEPTTGRVSLTLNWGKYGTSKVFAHEVNKTWYYYQETN